VDTAILRPTDAATEALTEREKNSARIPNPRQSPVSIEKIEIDQPLSQKIKEILTELVHVAKMEVVALSVMRRSCYL